MALIDLQKAYDTVNREKLWRILESRCRNETDGTLAMLIIKMYQQSQVVIGKHSFSADLGVVQGGVLSFSTYTSRRRWVPHRSCAKWSTEATYWRSPMTC